jgi:hypothetical protein
MTLVLIEPHVKYKNLDVQHFRCECGSALSYQVPRIGRDWPPANAGLKAKTGTRATIT